MANKAIVDKAISDLIQATQITGEDLFVLEQSGEAKKLKGETLLDFVTLSVVSVTVTTLPAGSSATATYDKSTGTLALGIPQGSKGDTGATGATGPANVLTIGSVTSGKVASATITGEAPNQVLNLVLEKGDKGETGEKGATGDTGPQGEQGIQGPQGSPGADAPTITNITIRQSDYHLIVTLSDGTSYDAGYCRGASGAGTGDMLASVYDPNNKHQDIFAYVDNAIKDVKVTTDATPTQGSTNPVQSGGVYSALNNKLDKTGDGSNVTAAFTAASTRANIATGEKLSVLFGKIAKWFRDLGSLAFKSKVAKSDLASDVQTSLDKADSALQSAPVTSVNGETGEVTVSVPTASTTTPKAPGTAAAGSEKTYARGDHVHPKELPNGGSTGQVLTKTESGTAWQDAQGGTGADSIFWATYGTTTFEEVKAAFDAGKQVFVFTERGVHSLIVVDDTGCVFSLVFAWATSLNKPVLQLVFVNINGWYMETVALLSDKSGLGNSRKVTLTVAGWNSSTKQQSVACSGVLSDATKQLLIPTPVNTAAGNPYDEASIQMVAQGANSVTFYAETVPTEAIDVYVTMYPANYLG